MCVAGLNPAMTLPETVHFIAVCRGTSYDLGSLELMSTLLTGSVALRSMLQYFAFAHVNRGLASLAETAANVQLSDGRIVAGGIGGIPLT